jgi:hypothetical protein
MKLLIVTSIKEDIQPVTRIFEDAQIPVFSVTETVGHKSEHNDYLLNNWFARSDAETNALLFFSFTDDTKASVGLELVRKYNLEHPGNFPIRAFIVPVEKSSY